MSPGNTPPDPFEILLRQHEAMRGYLRALADRSLTADERRELIDRLKAEIERHSRVEEKVVYSRLRLHDPRHRYAARDDHADFIGHLSGMSQALGSGESLRRFLQQLKIFSKGFEEHAREEEREVFPAARQVLDDETLRELAAELEDELGPQK